MSPRGSNARRNILPAIALVALTAAVYAPVAHYPFVRFDDDVYILNNPLVNRGLTAGSLALALTATRAANWHPVAWISHMLDVQLFGLDAGGHHLVNLLLHLANTTLLFHALRRMTGAACRSFFVAALFALHPLHVETVAWVTERKDLLATFFGLLTVLAYLRSLERPGRLRSAAVCALFALSLASKPMLVTLPFLLLLLDVWPLQRLGPGAGPGSVAPLLREKIPLFVLSALSSLVTVAVQARGGTVQGLQRFPLPTRAGNALVTYVTYLFQTIWPADLAAFYPHPGAQGLPWPLVALSAGTLCALSWAVLRARRDLPWLAVGWFWYLGLLVPVIGLVQVGEQARADRYTYLPLVGVFVMIVWGAAHLARGRPRGGTLLAAGGALVLAALAIACRIQVGSWRDEETLFRRAIAVTRGNWFAYNNLGVALFSRGRPDEAAAAYRDCLRFNPGSCEAHNNLGALAFSREDYPAAASHFREAARLRPAAAEPRYNLGLAYERLGFLREAEDSYRAALRLDPAMAKARLALAGLLRRSGRRQGEASPPGATTN